jgi:transposase
MQLVNKAIDEVRRVEQKENSILKKTRYIWLKSINKLTDKQSQALYSLRSLNLKTARAYQMKLNLQEIWKIQDRDEAHLFLKKWYFWLTHSRLAPMISLAKTIRNHWEGKLNYFECRFTNALMEGLNSVVQSLKRSARGYKNTDNFITRSIYAVGNSILTYPLEIAKRQILWD